MEPVEFQRHNDNEEDNGQGRKEDREGYLVWRLLASGSFNESDHAVQKTLAGVCRHTDSDPIRQDFCSPGNGASVTAGLSDYGRRLPCNGRFINRGDPLGYFSVGRYYFTCGDEKHLSLSQLVGRNFLHRAIGTDTIGYRMCPRLAQSIRLRPASAFGHGLREIGEVYGEPEPQGDLYAETKIFSRRPEKEPGAHNECPSLGDEHDRIFDHVDRVHFLHGVNYCLRYNFPIKDRTCLDSHQLCPSIENL